MNKRELPNESDLLVNLLMRSEVNFIRLPIFPLDKKLVGSSNAISFTFTRKNSDGSIIKFRYHIIPMIVPEMGIDYGHGGPKDFIYLRTLEKILTEKHLDGETLDDQIFVGSFYYFAKKAGEKTMNKETYRNIYKFFKRLSTTSLVFENLYYDPLKKKWADGIESVKILEKSVLTGEKLPDGTIASGIYIWLSEKYKNGLKESYVKYINYEFYKKISKATSKRLFEILCLYSHKYERVYITYQELCARMPLKQFNHLSRAKQQIESIAKNLIIIGFLKSYEWIISENNWIIAFDINPQCNGQVEFDEIKELDLFIECDSDNIDDDSKSTLTPLARLWNQVCTDLPKVREISEDRRQKEKLRLKERSIDEWREVFERLNRSEFCKGVNERNWVATYDWVIKDSDNAVKVLEGYYDNPTIEDLLAKELKRLDNDSDFRIVSINIDDLLSNRDIFLEKVKLIERLLESGRVIIKKEYIEFVVKKDSVESFISKLQGIKKYSVRDKLISHDVFIKKMREALLLTNSNTNVKSIVELYKKVSSKNIEEDFSKAIDNLIEKGSQINYSNIKKELDLIVSSRISENIRKFRRWEGKFHKNEN